MSNVMVKKDSSLSKLFKLRCFIDSILDNLGYKNRKIPNSSGYEIIFPLATYAPWSLDGEFLKVYRIIKDFTLVDKYRCYELWYLVSQCSKLNGDILEVGVWRGGTGGLICKKVQLENINKTVFLADTFKGIVKASRRDKHYKGGEHGDTSIEMVQKLLSNLKVINFKILKGIFPEETAVLAENIKFCFCHIDVDTYQSAKDIFDWIWPQLVSGGIIIFDDYGSMSCTGITEFVNEESEKSDRLMIHNINGHAILIKVK